MSKGEGVAALIVLAAYVFVGYAAVDAFGTLRGIALTIAFGMLLLARSE